MQLFLKILSGMANCVDSDQIASSGAIMQLFLKILSGMANCVDSDQIASSGAI